MVFENSHRLVFLVCRGGRTLTTTPIDVIYGFRYGTTASTGTHYVGSAAIFSDFSFS